MDGFLNKYLGSLNSLAGPKMAKQLIQAGNKGILRPKRKNEYNLLDYMTSRGSGRKNSKFKFLILSTIHKP